MNIPDKGNVNKMISNCIDDEFCFFEIDIRQQFRVGRITVEELDMLAL